MKVRATAEDRKLIAEVVQIVRATVTASDSLRRQAHTVLFTATHGITATNPTSRAWYLLQIMTEHASLLA